MKSRYSAKGDGEYVLRFTEDEFWWFKSVICGHPFMDDEHPSIVKALEEAYDRGEDDEDGAKWFDHGELGFDEEDRARRDR